VPGLFRLPLKSSLGDQPKADEAAAEKPAAASGNKKKKRSR